MWAPPSEIIICELTIFDRQTQITPSEMIILLFSCYQVFFYHMYAIFFRMSGTISERQILMTLLDGTTARDRNQSIAHNLNYLWHTILLDCTIVRDLCTNPALGSVLVTKLVTTLIHPFHGKMQKLVKKVNWVYLLSDINSLTFASSVALYCHHMNKEKKNLQIKHLNEKFASYC